MARLWFLTKIKLFSGCLYLFVLLIISVSASEAEEEYRAWPGEFMRMGAGAKAMGMGNAYTAVEGDIYSSYFNPAGLAAMKGRALSLSINYLSMDRKLMYLAYGSRIGPDADFALSWIQSGTDDIQGRDLNGNPTGSLSDSRNAFTLSFSKNLNKYLSIGLNSKFSLWKLGGEDAKSFGFDLGVIARPVKNLTLSFVSRDIKSRYTWKSGYWGEKIGGSDGQPLEKTDKFPVYYTLGAAYKTLGEKLLISTTLESVQDNPLGLNAGISYDVYDRLAVRGGIYNYTSSDELGSGSMTLGFTIQLTGSASFDYAYVPDDFDGNSIHMISFDMFYGE